MGPISGHGVEARRTAINTCAPVAIFGASYTLGLHAFRTPMAVLPSCSHPRYTHALVSAAHLCSCAGKHDRGQAFNHSFNRNSLSEFAIESHAVYSLAVSKKSTEKIHSARLQNMCGDRTCSEDKAERKNKPDGAFECYY